MFCPYCGTLNPDDAVFCHKCGKALSGTNKSENQNQNHSSNPENNANISLSSNSNSNQTTQPNWIKYSPLWDKSISTLDKILFIVYLVLTVLVPISAVFSLIFLHLVRKPHVHSTYVKAVSFVIILLAVLFGLGYFFKFLAIYH
ncbi:MAG: zinc ribbon domain-containing protein [Desulfurella sp.]